MQHMKIFISFHKIWKTLNKQKLKQMRMGELNIVNIIQYKHNNKIYTVYL